MSNIAVAIQGAVYAALTADAALSDLIDGRVYDRVPVQEPSKLPEFPYVTIRDTQIVDDGADCVEGEEIYLDIHVFTRGPGLISAKRIGGAVKAVLHEADLDLGDGLHLIDCLFRDARYYMEPDGSTGHGIVTFLIHAEVVD